MSIEPRGRSPAMQAFGLVLVVLLGLTLYFWLAPTAPVVAKPPRLETTP